MEGRDAGVDHRDADASACQTELLTSHVGTDGGARSLERREHGPVQEDAYDRRFGGERRERGVVELGDLGSKSAEPAPGQAPVPCDERSVWLAGKLNDDPRSAAEALRLGLKQGIEFRGGVGSRRCGNDRDQSHREQRNAEQS